jgi:hypothetical protein
MTQDEIIRMAQEALLGSSLTHDDRGLRIWIEGADWHDEITRLAKLAYEAGAADEREALARYFEHHWRDRWTEKQIVEAIRARSKT